MELSSSVKKTWSLSAIWGLTGFLFLLIFLNQTHQRLGLLAPFSQFHYHSPPINNTTLLSKSLERQQPIEPLIPTIDFTKEDNNNINVSVITEIKDLMKEIQNVSVVNNEGNGNVSSVSKNKDLEKERAIIPKKYCNILDGKWVYKEEQGSSYNSCPFVSAKQNCKENGRPDLQYEKWRWEARECEVPLFDGGNMMERLRNKRMIMVGDSLSRNQWDSLVCLLYSSLPHSAIDVKSTGQGSMTLTVKDYNCTVEYYWSAFLVELNKNHESGRKVLVLDKISSLSKRWEGADIMVFNSDHWWNHPPPIRAWEAFQYKGQLINEMPKELAYRRAIKTWTKWLENNVDPKQTRVFYRTTSPVHYDQHSCARVTQPLNQSFESRRFPRSFDETVEKAIKRLRRSKVHFFDITKLSVYRRDAHPSIYTNLEWKNKKPANEAGDCSHWCLPGLPETWNRLLYASLFFDGLGFGELTRT